MVVVLCRSALALTKLNPPALTSGNPFDRVHGRIFFPSRKSLVPKRAIARRRRGARDEGALAGELTKEVVPVLGTRTQAADGRVKTLHALGHGFAGGIGVKAAVDGQALGD